MLFLVDGLCYIYDSHCHGEEGALTVECQPNAGWEAVVDALVELLGEIRDGHRAVVDLAA